MWKGDAVISVHVGVGVNTFGRFFEYIDVGSVLQKAVADGFQLGECHAEIH